MRLYGFFTALVLAGCGSTRASSPTPPADAGEAGSGGNGGQLEAGENGGGQNACEPGGPNSGGVGGASAGGVGGASAGEVGGASAGEAGGASAGEVGGASAGEVGAGGADDGVHELLLGEFAKRYAAAECSKISSCCTPQEAGQSLDGCAGTNEASSCPSRVLQCWYGAMTTAIAAGVEKGRMTFKGDVARACLETFKAMSCRQYADRPHLDLLPCPSIVEGRVAIGQPCANNYECISGSCERPDPPAEGVCGPMPGPGEACLFWNCPDGYFCDGTGATKCVAQRALGEWCSSSDNCESRWCSEWDVDAKIGKCSTFANAWCDGL